MDKVRGVIIALAFCFALALSLGTDHASGDHNVQNNVKTMHEEPSDKGMLQNSYSLVTKSSKMYWEGIKSVINQIQISLFPPDIDFRSTFAPSDNGHDEGHNGAGVKMKEAVEKSFQTSKVAVEESAKSAAKVVGEAVHKTADKLKETTSVPQTSTAEL